MSESTYYDHPRAEMAAFLPDGARRVLDIGCGAGRFATAIKDRFGLEVWGLEVDPTAAETAAGSLDRVLVGDALQRLDDVPAGRFDCIYLNDVLEHLVDPEALLQALPAKLAPRGRVVASLPNVRYFPHLWDLVIRGRWEYRDEGILDRTHLRFFTRSSTAAMFQRCGYRIEQSQGLRPTGSRLFRLCNLLTLGQLAETRYLQFAWVVVPL